MAPVNAGVDKCARRHGRSQHFERSLQELEKLLRRKFPRAFDEVTVLCAPSTRHEARDWDVVRWVYEAHVGRTALAQATEKVSIMCSSASDPMGTKLKNIASLRNGIIRQSDRLFILNNIR